MRYKRLLVGSFISCLTLFTLLTVNAQPFAYSIQITSAHVTCVTFPPQPGGYGDPMRGVMFTIEYTYQAGDGAYLWRQADINDGGSTIGEEVISSDGNLTFDSGTGSGPTEYPYSYKITIRLYSLDTTFDFLPTPVGTILAEGVMEGDCTDSSSIIPVDIPFDPHDGRINPDAGAPFAVYCTESGLQVYKINSDSEGYLVMMISAEILAAEPPAENTLLDEVDGLHLYRLSTGELQINANLDDAKEYVLTWNGCPVTSSHVTTSDSY